MRSVTITGLALTLIISTFQWVLHATNSWGGYHWARTSNPFTVNLGDNVSSAWDSYLTVASGDWGQSDVLNTSIVAGQVFSPRKCRPTPGRVEVCNSAYGNNGWLGVAQIWVNGLHITQGTVKLNDTYFNTATYNTPGWRQMVACQEIGHTFGLDHQDTDFYNPNLGTCMDYTNNPLGPPSNLSPNKHDYDELDIIYAHLDSTTTLSSSPAASHADVEDPSQWGQLMKTTHGGKTQVFEKVFSNGERIVTFVIWA
jgi:hypothetical protein